MHLLDTNVWVAHLRGRSDVIRRKLAGLTSDDIVLCSVVLAELYYGASRSAHPAKNRAAVDFLVTPFRCLPFDAAAAVAFAQIRQQLEAAGTPIGPYDLQIAAIARVHGATVVTRNVKEFGRVSGLTVEDWEGLS